MCFLLLIRNQKRKTTRNQILGAVAMGIGIGMFEETVPDVRTLLAHWVGQQGKDSSIDWKKNG